MHERDLFIAALQIEGAAERSAYLDRACAGEATLRQGVEALLAALARAGSFLQQPAADLRAMPDGSFCVANAFTTGLATFYDRSGHVLRRTITVPGSAAGSAYLGLGPVGHPTGVVYNPTSDFVISEGGKSAPARLIFDSIDGTLSGWNPHVDPTHAILLRDTFAAGHPAVYTGLDMAQNSQGRNVLYAADILSNRVEMIDGSFHTIGSFTDPTVAGFADGSFSAWSVQAQNGNLYVTFASLKDFDGGVVDVFDADGHLLTPNHFAANAPGAGPLQNPWGITQAPAKFGAYSNDLLIGNVAGAGNINAFDPATGAYLGQLRQPDGAPVAITGLWDLDFGDGTPHSGKTNQLFFDAGPNAPGVSVNGLFGVIRAAGDQGGNGGDPVREAAAGEALTVNGSVSVPVSSISVGLSSSPPTSGSQGIAALSPMSGTVVTADLFAPPTTTGAASPAGTTAGTTGDGVATADSSGASDLPLLGWPQATAQPADFFAALSTIMKKASDTSTTIPQNLK